jgi:hypothetical protein
LAIRILISTVVPLRRTFTIAKRERAPAKPPAYYLWCSNHKVNVLAQVGAELSPIEDATCGPQRARPNQQGDHLPMVSPQPVPRSSPFARSVSGTAKSRGRLKPAVNYNLTIVTCSPLLTRHHSAFRPFPFANPPD